MNNQSDSTKGQTRLTDEQLRAAFEAVQNQTNWKLPVSKLLRKTALSDAVIHEAVIYFTGSVPRIVTLRHWVGDKRDLRVTAVGYYAAVGA